MITELMIPINNKEKRILCHTVSSIMKEQTAGREDTVFGVFLDPAGIIIRLNDAAKSVFFSDESTVSGIPPLAGLPVYYRQFALEPRYSQLIARIDYGKTSRRGENGSNFKLVENNLACALSEKPVIKGISAGKTLVQSDIIEGKPRLRKDIVRYGSGANKKELYIKEFSAILSDVKVLDPDLFTRMLIEGAGTKKSYGCGLIKLTS